MQTCQGPRSQSQPPVTPVPPLACDCHSHILGPTQAFPYVEDRSFTPPDATVADYQRVLSTLGFERGIVVQASVYGSDNSRTVAAVNELGQHRARGVVMVDASVSEAELARLDAAGMRATRFITTARGGPSLDDLPEVAAKVAAFGWHVEMYVPTGAWEALLPVLPTLPVPVVFDHMGGLPSGTREGDPILHAMLDMVERDRAWIKLCGYRNSSAGYPYDDVAALGSLLAKRAPDRCVWGSDWPHTNIAGHMPDDGELFDLLADWVPDAAARARILVDNPAALYRFD